MNINFSLAPVFTDHMVLQRNCFIPVWGSGLQGCKVSVELCGRVAETESHKGSWRVELPPMEAGGPYEMKIQCGDSQMILKDILIGEVWVAGGQSNMEFMLADSLHGKSEAAAANFDGIRYYNVPKIAWEEAGENMQRQPGWQVCTPETSGKFSAVAYYFAKSLYEDIKIPVGILGCNWGGTSASCWMSEQYLQSGNKTGVYMKEHQDLVNKVSDEEYENQIKEYSRKVLDFNRKAESFKLANPDAPKARMDQAVGSYPWPPPYGRKSYRRPCGLYHFMLEKIIPYSVRGVLFYQGEEDTGKPEVYKELFGLLRKNWRDAWNNPSLPFLFVQLPYFNDEMPGKDWALLREAQLQTMLSDPDTAMAVITDCGERDDVHPVNKKPVGERLALLARNKIYGRDVKCFSPIYSSMRMEGGKAVLSFEHAEDGLCFTGGELKGFTICGEDRKFVEAKAEIKGSTVEVEAEGVDTPVTVRYGWANYADVNLYNKSGLPVSPFRTDSF